MLIPETDDFSRAPEKQVFDWLEQHGIEHHTTTHAPTFTVAESANVKADMPGGHTKTLFLKDKKGNLVLVSAWAHSQLPLNKLHRLIGTQRLSFTKADLLWEVLKVTPGSVSAFTLIHDVEQEVKFVLDTKLMEYDWVNFHPLRCDMTTRISRDDLVRFIRTTRRGPESIDFSTLP